MPKSQTMKNIFLGIALFLGIFINAQEAAPKEIQWVSIEEADSLQEKNPEKPLFIDIYTDWCGWCKKMDKSTFMDEQIVAKINSDYIPVKLDAETKKDISFKGNTFSYLKAGRSGVNTLAYHLLQGQLSFPSYVIFKDNSITHILRGFLSTEELMSTL